MATLDELRPKLRIQLGDTNDNQQVWTDAELDEHLSKSLDVYDSYVPLLSENIVYWPLGPSVSINPPIPSPTSSDVRVNNPIHPVRVEFPIDQDPPVYIPFVFGIGVTSVITVVGPTKPAERDQVRVYMRVHTQLSNIFPHHEQGIVTGAWAYALRARAPKLMDRSNPSLAVADRLLNASQTALAEFGNFLTLARDERRNYDTITHDILEDPDAINRYRARTLQLLLDGTKDGIEQGSMSPANARTLVNRFVGLSGSPPTSSESVAAQTNEQNANTLRLLTIATGAGIDQKAMTTADARLLINAFSELTGAAPTPAETTVTAGGSAGRALALQRLGNGLEDFVRQGVINRQTARLIFNEFADTTGDAPADVPDEAGTPIATIKPFSFLDDE